MAKRGRPKGSKNKIKAKRGRKIGDSHKFVTKITKSGKPKSYAIFRKVDTVKTKSKVKEIKMRIKSANKKVRVTKSKKGYTIWSK